jgi:hypothetical protein
VFNYGKFINKRVRLLVWPGMLTRMISRYSYSVCLGASALDRFSGLSYFVGLKGGPGLDHSLRYHYQVQAEPNLFFFAHFKNKVKEVMEMYEKVAFCSPSGTTHTFTLAPL